MKRTGNTATQALAGLGLAAGLGWMALYGGLSHASAAQPVGASATIVSTQPVTMGCNELVYTNLPVGGKVGDWVNANVSPSSVAISVWHFNNASQHYQAMWFSNPQVPVDAPTFSSAVDSFFLCVNASGTAP